MLSKFALIAVTSLLSGACLSQPFFGTEAPKNQQIPLNPVYSAADFGNRVDVLQQQNQKALKQQSDARLQSVQRSGATLNPTNSAPPTMPMTAPTPFNTSSPTTPLSSPELTPTSANTPNTKATQDGYTGFHSSGTTNETKSNSSANWNIHY